MSELVNGRLEKSPPGGIHLLKNAQSLKFSIQVLSNLHHFLPNSLGGCPYPGVSNRRLYDMLKSGYRMEKPNTCSNEW